MGGGNIAMQLHALGILVNAMPLCSFCVPRLGLTSLTTDSRASLTSFTKTLSMTRLTSAALRPSVSDLLRLSAISHEPTNSIHDSSTGPFSNVMTEFVFNSCPCGTSHGPPSCPSSLSYSTLLFFPERIFIFQMLQVSSSIMSEKSRDRLIGSFDE